jgi:ATP/maltotriose-dependent transcriptional regulator MalT
LALLRLAQGDREGATNFIRRVVGATNDPFLRTRFLPAYVEISLAAGDLEGARAASSELQRTAATFNTEVLSAIAQHAYAAVSLVEGNPQAVLDPARRSFRIWQQLGAPYLAARLRVLLARACLALEDTESAQMELECAREVFEQLGAGPDVAAVTALEQTFGSGGGTPAPCKPHRLTQRELQVLRLVAKGCTNKVIARELSLSEKTVDRHVSNIFAKISVSSRAAATAFAYEHQLL